MDRERGSLFLLVDICDGISKGIHLLCVKQVCEKFIVIICFFCHSGEWELVD